MPVSDTHSPTKPDKPVGNTIAFFSAALIVILPCAAMFFFWAGRVPPADKNFPVDKRIAAVTERQKTVVQIAGGLFLVLTAYGSWRSFRAADANARAANENARIANQNLIITQNKQSTEYFVKATENLGSEKMPTRIGAIYSLGQMARNSEQEHALVFEVITAFIKQKTYIADIRNDSGEKALEEKIDEISMSLDYAPPADIRAAIIAIGQRSNIYNEWLQLHHCFLPTILFTNANNNEGKPYYFGKVNFAFGCVAGSLFDDSCLKNASFYFTDIRRSSFEDTDCTAVNFRKAKTEGASFLRTITNKADLRGVDLSEVRHLTQKQVNAARISRTTILPLGLQLPPEDELEEDVKNE